MPKIKVNNIPERIRNRMCSMHMLCSTCPFYLQKKVLLPNGITVFCLTDIYYDSRETKIELSEIDFPTNRDWMENLSNEDLAAFMTTGLFIRGGKYNGFKTTISLITDKEEMSDWLSQPCVYLMEEEQNDSNDIG